MNKLLMEKGGDLVQSLRKKINQWFFNISKFSQELLDGLGTLDKWPNKVKVMQKNWIGKSFGCEINFKIEGDLPVENVKCFTTRPDTLFGFFFLALSVDHEISKFFLKTKTFKSLNLNVQKLVLLKKLLQLLIKLVKTNLFAINPLNPKHKVPVYFANFVLIDYGFGAVFGCRLADQKILISLKSTNLRLKQ